MTEKRRVELNSEMPSLEVIKVLEHLMANIKGQDEAIKDLADAIEIYNSGLQNEGRPIYTALFLGSSGVGKTLTAEVLAEYWFGDRTAFTRIACEAYSEDHAIAKLIGSPPGYVGFWNPEDKQYKGAPPILFQGNIDKFDPRACQHEKSKKELDELKKGLEYYELLIMMIVRERYLGGFMNAGTIKRLLKQHNCQNIDELLRILLGEYEELKVRIEMYVDMNKQKDNKSEVKPRAIILFDEIEKASDTLRNILLNIMDKAQIQLANGMITKFDNCVIIMTSNIGSKAIAGLLSKKQGLGFRPVQDEHQMKETSSQMIYDQAMEAARNFFAPEFLARFDRISVFRPLTREVMRQILDVEIRKFQEQLNKCFPILLNFAGAAKEYVLNKSTDRPENGARLIKMKLKKYLRKQIARMINRNEIKKGDELYVDVKELPGGKKVLAYFGPVQEPEKPPDNK